MTASIVKSLALTAQLVTDPRTRQADTTMGAPVRMYAATTEVAITSIDEIADVVLLVAIPSNAVVHDLRILTDDLDSNATPTLAYDVGVYNGPEKFTVPVSGTPTNYAEFGEIVVGAFATAITVGQAAVTTAVTNNGFEARDIANVHKKVWELVGFDKDPNKTLVIGIKVTTVAATPAAGTLTIQVLASH